MRKREKSKISEKWKIKPANSSDDAGLRWPLLLGECTARYCDLRKSASAPRSLPVIKQGPVPGTSTSAEGQNSLKEQGGGDRKRIHPSDDYIRRLEKKPPQFFLVLPNSCSPLPLKQQQQQQQGKIDHASGKINKLECSGRQGGIAKKDEDWRGKSEFWGGEKNKIALWEEKKCLNSHAPFFNDRSLHCV